MFSADGSWVDYLWMVGSIVFFVVYLQKSWKNFTTTNNQNLIQNLVDSHHKDTKDVVVCEKDNSIVFTNSSANSTVFTNSSAVVTNSTAVNQNSVENKQKNDIAEKQISVEEKQPEPNINIKTHLYATINVLPSKTLTVDILKDFCNYFLPDENKKEIADFYWQNLLEEINKNNIINTNELLLLLVNNWEKAKSEDERKALQSGDTAKIASKRYLNHVGLVRSALHNHLASSGTKL